MQFPKFEKVFFYSMMLQHREGKRRENKRNNTRLLFVFYTQARLKICKEKVITKCYITTGTNF